MKKYYISTNGNQEGPFSIEDLQNKQIQRNTLVWFEGNDAWLKAEEVEELKTILGKLPPPSPPPPPLAATIDNSEFAKEKRVKRISEKTVKVLKVLRTVVISVVALWLAIVLYNYFSHSAAGPGFPTPVQVVVNPPDPQIVDRRSYKDETSDLFNYNVAVDGTVVNNGGEGTVLIQAILEQGSNRYERSKKIKLRAGEAKSLHFVFQEAKRLGAEMTFDFKATVIN